MKKIKAFTLIEVLIYSALTSIIIVYSLGGVYSLIQGSAQLQDRAIIDQEANFLLKKIGWSLSSLQEITTPPSGGSDDVLTVSRYNFSSNPITFDLNSGNLRMKVGTDSAIILNNDRTVIDNLTFDHIAATATTPTGVKTTMSINSRIYTMTIYRNE